MPVPLFRIEIVKELDNEQWSNDWLTDVATMDDAVELADQLQFFERNVHQNRVQFTYMRVSSYVPGDRTFRHIDTNLPGQAGNFEYLPLFNTMRLNLGTEDSDPGRKYFRLPLAEANQVNGLIDSAYLAALALVVLNTLVTTNAVEKLVTPKGNRIITASWYNRVQMRQLHRRRKKKITP